MRTSPDRMSVQLVQGGEDNKDSVFSSLRTPGEGSEMKTPSRETPFVATQRRIKADATVAQWTSRRGVADERILEPDVSLRTLRCDGLSPVGGSRHSSASTPVEQGSPPHLRWARNLKNLLDDKEGVDLLTQYLEQEGCGSKNIHFYYACEGMKKGYPIGSKDQLLMIKVIYKTYVKYSKIVIREATRQEIVQKINSRTGIDETIFDLAQKELLENYLQNAYANFLKSDIYLRHVQKAYDKMEEEEDEVPSSLLNPNDELSRETLNLLPTLHEEREFSSESWRNPHFVPFAQRDKSSRHKSNREPTRFHHPDQGYYSSRARPASHLKYSGYQPTSAQDSELQSLSSDAQTDDTMSTEGSLIEMYHSSRRKQHKAMRLNASINRDASLMYTVIPRTQRVSPVRLAEEQPKDFAAVLIDKLSKVQKDIDDHEKLNVSLRMLNMDDGKCCQTSSHLHSFDRFSKIAPLLLYSATAAKVEDTDNGQDILDQHVSRVWEKSNCNSPLSPVGANTPPAVLPLDRRKPPVMPPWSVHQSKNPGCGQPLYNVSRRRERDACSSDSGTFHDFTPDNSEVHRYQKSQHSVMPAAEERRLKDGGQKRAVNQKKNNNVTDSGSSCVDSGVSVCDPCVSTNISTHERVFSWVSENEKYAPTRSDSDVRHNKKSSSSLSTQSSSKQSSKKSRGATLDYSSGLMQPLAQDPSMPILPPPDTTTQLVEAKRRLEDEAAKTKLLKSSSKVDDSFRKSLSKRVGPTAGQEVTVIGYCFSGESVPYRTKMAGRNITLRQFKALISKKGNYRYFFKRSNNEFGTGVVNEEVSDDNETLPLWEGKIFCTIEPVLE